MLNDKILRQDTTAGDSRSATVACVFKVGLDKNLDARFGGSPTGGRSSFGFPYRADVAPSGGHTRMRFLARSYIAGRSIVPRLQGQIPAMARNWDETHQSGAGLDSLLEGIGFAPSVPLL